MTDEKETNQIVEKIEEPEAPEPVPRKKGRQKRKVTGDVAKKPKKPRFRRGKHVLCMLVTPGETTAELLKLRKEEDIIVDRDQDRIFTVSCGPALRIENKKETLDCYIVDAHKGCTVYAEYQHTKDMLAMYTNPETTYDLIDQHFVSQIVDLKPDWKQSAGMAFGSGLLAFMFGLMF